MHEGLTTSRTFEEERLVQEQREAATGCAQLLVKPVILFTVALGRIAIAL